MGRVAPLMRATSVPAETSIVPFGYNAVDEYVSLIKAADGPISAEMYNLGRGSVTSALRDRASSGLAMDLTLDRVIAGRPFTQRLADSGASVTTYDAARTVRADHPACLHSKAIVAGTHGMISTGTMTSLTPQKLELSALLPPEASAALREVIDAGRAGDPAAIKQTAEAAMRHGIVLNDPIAGVHGISRELEQLVDESTKNLTLVTKELDDASMTKRLVAARDRGVDVRLVVGDLGSADQALLDDAGIAVERMPLRNRGLDAALQHRLHFTALMRDDATRGYFGSQYPWHGAHTGRELGIVVEGDVARRTQAAIEQQVDRSTGTIVTDMLRQRASTLTEDPLRTSLAAGGVGSAGIGAALLRKGD